MVREWHGEGEARRKGRGTGLLIVGDERRAELLDESGAGGAAGRGRDVRRAPSLCDSRRAREQKQTVL